MSDALWQVLGRQWLHVSISHFEITSKYNDNKPEAVSRGRQNMPVGMSSCRKLMLAPLNLRCKS
ncbi:hypothetical protein ACFO1V_07500 [Daeguia caeni]|uniref:Uncharacterized protein n=1 Tax=Daeguia caeni TaxID=439612 RepID=A0ABV9H5T0_9HYPH